MCSYYPMSEVCLCLLFCFIHSYVSLLALALGYVCSLTRISDDWRKEAFGLIIGLLRAQ